MTHPHVPFLGAPFRTVRILTALVALVALSGCAAAVVTTGAVAVAGAGIGAVASDKLTGRNGRWVAEPRWRNW